jgi:hypothetical protein
MEPRLYYLQLLIKINAFTIGYNYKSPYDSYIIVYEVIIGVCAYAVCGAFLKNDVCVYAVCAHNRIQFRDRILFERILFYTLVGESAKKRI